jgi:peptidoglycan hydrolase CwlO-like protein
MKEYAGLVRERDKALSIFTSTRDRLLRVIESMRGERDKSADKIAQETAKIRYLEQQITQTGATTDAIEKVLGGVA